MSKVRIGREEVFNDYVTDADNIPNMCGFDFNHKWVANHSDANRIAARKIKTYSMNLTAEVWFAMDDVNNNQQHTQIHYALIDNQPVTDLLKYVVIVINKFIDILYPDTFRSTVNYL
jgi:hypothetical protein